jgi:hypothetical protein
MSNKLSRTEEIRVTKRLANLVLSLALLSAYSVAQETEETTGTVHGVVTADAGGGRVVVPRIKVILNGPAHIEAASNDEGRFAVSAVPPGSYKVTAQIPGLSAAQDVVIAAGSVAEVALEMKVTLVAESTTVTVSAKADDSVTASTVGGSTVQTAPNITERFDSLLPLVPGVVRGPDGLISMKGARSSQNGSLVNNADVTDPVTGESAISLPIDVVSSVQVLSTPYDPVYSKFTGAVSNVETRTGNFTKFRASAQNLIPRLRYRDGSIVGVAAVTPRVMFTGPVVRGRVALTQSFEYRYERTPVISLPLFSGTQELRPLILTRKSMRLSVRSSQRLCHLHSSAKTRLPRAEYLHSAASHTQSARAGISSRAPTPIYHHLRKPAELTTEFQTL